VPDLTLSEYEDFSEKELKDILIEEKRKIYGSESIVKEIASNKMKAFREVLLSGRTHWNNHDTW
jgi:hypothetical protein